MCKTTRSLQRWLPVILLLSLAGLGVSAHLSLLHWQVHNVPGHVSFCAINDRVNCDTVAQSSHSIIVGLPLAYWGVMFYCLLIILSGWGLKARDTSWPWGVVSLLNLGAVCVSGYFLLVSEVIVESFCIMCIAIYAINFLMAIVVGRGLWRMGCSLRSIVNWFLLAVLATGCTFAVVFSTALSASTSSIMLAAASLIIVVGGLNYRARGSVHELRKLWGIVCRDLNYLFRRPAVGGGLVVASLAVLVAMLVVTPRLYASAQPAVEVGGVVPPLGIGALTQEQADQLQEPADQPKTERAVIAGGLNGVEHGVTEDGFHWIGAREPQVVITEYSDYECPFCRKAHEIVRQVVRERRDEVRLVHVQMPLDHTCNPNLTRPFHQHACHGALAAICAGQQGAFWPMNDQLFVHRCQLGFEELVDLAGSMGLDESVFEQCMDSGRARRALQQNLAACVQRRLRPATPTFSIGDQVVRGLRDKNWWLRVIDGFEYSAGVGTSGDLAQGS